ncbi:MAG: hypothetical protein ABJD97_22370 [Betaproteobacteria bacterium]
MADTPPESDPARLEAERLRRLKKRWLVAVVVGLPLIQFARLLLFDRQNHLRSFDEVIQAAKSLFG